jgi:glycerol-3-phosphate dehydrogenase
MRLDDLLLRRTMLAMLGRLTKEIVLELADILGDSLGWSVDQKNAEVARALHLLSDRHGVAL